MAEFMVFVKTYGPPILLFAVSGIVLWAATTMPNDNKAAMTSQIQVMGIFSFIFICIFGYFMNSYIQNNPDLSQTYMLFVIYISLFISLMSISITTTHI